MRTLMLLQLAFNLIMEVLVVLAAATSSQRAISLRPGEYQQVAKPDCHDKCGNVTIPYPFGTTHNCYYNEDFLITRNDTHYEPPKPFLRTGNIDVTNISVDGKLYINQYIAKDCYYKSGASRESNTPSSDLPKFFIISNTDNMFVVVGCDTSAEIQVFQGEHYGYTGGCISKCDSIDYVANYSCSGIGCCQTSIAEGTSYFDVTVTSFNNHPSVWDFNPCSYAFVVEESKFNFLSNMLKDLENVTEVPVVLDWSIGNETCSKVLENKLGMKNYACEGSNSTCFGVENGSGYRCKCKEGYQVNPYLEGCHDIDECEDPNLNNCKQRCINTEAITVLAAMGTMAMVDQREKDACLIEP